MLNWLRSSMGKLTVVAELFVGRHFDRNRPVMAALHRGGVPGW
jgi:hypothetical protein